MLRHHVSRYLFFPRAERAGLEHGGATGASTVEICAKLISLIAAVLVKHIELFIIEIGQYLGRA